MLFSVVVVLSSFKEYFTSLAVEALVCGRFILVVLANTL